jgi:hypothetical protein
MTLIPNDFPCNEDYLSKFKTLIILCIDCKTKLKEDRCNYIILYKLGSAYSMFVSRFDSIGEDLGSAYQNPSLEFF